MCPILDRFYLSFLFYLFCFFSFGAIRPQLFPRYFSPYERLATRCLIIAVKIIIHEPTAFLPSPSPHRFSVAALLPPGGRLVLEKREPQREPCNYNTSVECES